MFSLTVKLFRSTRPCVVGVLGAPKTCLMLCFSHISVIVLLLNSLLLSERSFEGKPNIQDKFSSVVATSLVSLLFRGNSHEYLLKWSITWVTQLCLELHSHGRLRKSMRSISTCSRSFPVVIGYVIAFLVWFSHFFVAGVAYKVKQTMLLLLEKFQTRRFLRVSLFYLFLYMLCPSELHTVHHESLSLVLHICYLR